MSKERIACASKVSHQQHEWFKHDISESSSTWATCPGLITQIGVFPPVGSVNGHEVKYCGDTNEHGMHSWTDAPTNEKYHTRFMCLGSLFEPFGIPEEVVDVFIQAWESERKKIGRGIGNPGSKTRAGLSAALKVLYLRGDLDSGL